MEIINFFKNDKVIIKRAEEIILKCKKDYIWKKKMKINLLKIKIYLRFKDHYHLMQESQGASQSIRNVKYQRQ